MLKGKTVVVTGATGGIGRAVCRALAEQGAKLALTATNPQALAEFCGELQQQGYEVTYAAADITNEEQVQAFAAQAAEAFGKLDALVNLAGVSIPGKIVETSEDVYDRMIDVNLKGTYLMCRHFVPCAAEDARIINVGSMAARRTNANAPLYCTAKAAVNTFSQGLAMQLAGQKIHVTAVNPGGADTPFWGDRPVKREKLLQPQDVADVILFVLTCHPRMAIHSVDFESLAMV